MGRGYNYVSYAMHRTMAELTAIGCWMALQIKSAGAIITVNVRPKRDMQHVV